MGKYVYPAIFTPEEQGGYSISFPDVEGCFTQGETLEEGLKMANDVLCLTLYGLEKDEKPIPAASEVNAVKHEKDEFVTLVACDTMVYRRYYEKKAVKKTLSIPSWLNELAEENHINFSSVLQAALKKQLHITD